MEPNGIIDYQLANIDFLAVYNSIVENVEKNFNIIFSPKIKSRIEELDFDFSAFHNAQLTDFIYLDPNGRILISNDYYSANPDLFKVINIATYEIIINLVKVNISSFKDGQNQSASLNDIYEFSNQFKIGFMSLLKKELKKHYNLKRVETEKPYMEFYYDSKEDYIKSCINSAILNTIILFYSSSTIYKDYKKINNANKPLTN